MEILELDDVVELGAHGNVRDLLEGDLDDDGTRNSAIVASAFSKAAPSSSGSRTRIGFAAEALSNLDVVDAVAVQLG